MRPAIHRSLGWKSDKVRKAEADKLRPSSSSRGYDSRWRRARKAWLSQHPLCVSCHREHNIVTAATVVDHIIAHKGDVKLFWDTNNWQSLCASCHSRKTTNEGRWG
jgi:5-methylcytosine-specific restriction protein A